MNNRSSQTIPILIWRSVIQAVILAVLAGFLLPFIYGLVHHYQDKNQQIQQLATLLTISASTADGADIVAEQVSVLLENEPTIQSIVFYSTSEPIDDINQSLDDWKNALFADTVSFNYPVISKDIDTSSVVSNKFDTNQVLAMTLSDIMSEASVTDASTDEATQNSTLIGYINITMDVELLRLHWFRNILWLWLAVVVLIVIFALYIFRKLNWPIKDIEALTDVCDIVINNANLAQLPVIQQRFNFQELVRVQKALIVLFSRLQEARQGYETLADFEQQLHNKDVSLDVQLHNFQSMISHELKTSLNAIVGGLQLLDYETLSREQKDAVEIISNGSDKLVLSLDNIIQLNQIQKGQIRIHKNEFNPLQLIADLLAKFESIATQKGLQFISNIHHIDYSLYGDSEKIHQILSILLNNAIKFTPIGQITITSQLTHFNKSNRWQISVKDTGIGIDSEHIDDIFNPFFQVDSSQTRQYEGSGVGLPIVKQMAQLMGATIEVDSVFGVGSQFTLTVAMPNQQQSKQQRLLSGLRIVYYYYHETGALLSELEYLGATIVCHQNSQLVMEEVNKRKIDMVMFAEDVLPNKAESLAKRIRQYEGDESNKNEHRALLVYWYPHHRARYIDSFDYGLKAAGIDYCHIATYREKALSDLLKQWLVWT
ncbi:MULTISPECIES: HAMP domain-containing sensor histidine kinase [unclassified Psychrobacter]|uniref:sensor histidine kinase n=1 Tax=unclassified Psychrobacter TaxID=196806 RepID=UPI0025B5EE66|nr:MULTISPECIES: HAMP domain-containing sensor histidine kinase [unclassified Psychrobacter]MDN3453856.1 HAMP domain-containing sensor histidine kinase [Psychrobacter sp. APC 3350]MDN3501309.1 HAMP domain-containing sensor histidine kinase [Psychrobacter sp. 5A.1]